MCLPTILLGLAGEGLTILGLAREGLAREGLAILGLAREGLAREGLAILLGLL